MRILATSVVVCALCACVASAEELSEPIVRANGRYAAQARRGDAWRTVGVIAFDRYTRTRSLVLGERAAGARSFRLLESGGGAAHVDCVLVDGRPPVAARGAPLAKLTARDDDIVECKDNEIEVTFDRPARAGSVLALSARVEPTEISNEPFRFPPRNTFKPMTERSQFYTYVIGRRSGALTVDGEIARERLGDALFDEYMVVGSGHPQGRTYGWVSDDGRTLYAAIDFTSDNTMDGEKDYAAVWAKTSSGLREFRVTLGERRWGRAGFTYTKRVGYQHKVYEFAIPLSELGRGLKPGDRVELSFAAYGTSTPLRYAGKKSLAFCPDTEQYAFALLGADLQFFDRDGATVGGVVDLASGETQAIAWNPTSSEYLFVYASLVATEGVFGLRLDSAGSTIGSTITVSAEDLDNYPTCVTAVDHLNDRYLVAWARAGTGNEFLHARLVDGDGTPLGAGPVEIGGATGVPAIDPDVAFDPTNEQYMVVWHDTAGIKARFVDADGTEGASTIDVVTGYEGAAVAYDPLNDRFLVAYFDTTNDDVLAKFVSSAGVVDGSTITAIDLTGISLGYPAAVSAGYSSQLARFIVGLGDEANCHWRFVDADGTPLGTATQQSGSSTGLGFAANELDRRVGIALRAGVPTMYFAPDVTLVITPFSGLQTTEGGGQAAFEVYLSKLPTDTVTLSVTSQDTGEGTVDTSTLTFLVGDWDVPQTVTVTGRTDSENDGNVTYVVRVAIQSTTDVDFGALSPVDVSLRNVDTTPPRESDDCASGPGAPIALALAGLAVAMVALRRRAVRR